MYEGDSQLVEGGRRDVTIKLPRTFDQPIRTASPSAETCVYASVSAEFADADRERRQRFGPEQCLCIGAFVGTYEAT